MHEDSLRVSYVLKYDLEYVVSVILKR